jgi:hypothetical protein
MDAIDFEDVVARAADKVERDQNVGIEPNAREVLVSRARAHEADIYKTLSDLGLAERDLEDAAERQFQDAVVIHRTKYPVVFSRRMVDAASIEAGMRWRCHFVPWC